jgi:hypothetical protein
MHILDRVVSQGQSMISTARASIVEQIWLQFMSTQYTDDILEVVRESILRTLAVVPKTEFVGTLDDVSNTVLTPQSALAVDAIAFSRDPAMVIIGTSLTKARHVQLRKAIQFAGKGTPTRDLFPFGLPTPIETPFTAQINTMRKTMTFACIASGYTETYTPSVNHMAGLSDESTRALYTQNILKENTVFRPGLRHAPPDWGASKLYRQYEHVKRRVAEKPIASTSHVRSSVVVMLSVDVAWDILRTLDLEVPDVQCHLFRKSDFQKHVDNYHPDLGYWEENNLWPDAPMVPSWWTQDGRPRQVGPNREYNDVVENTSALFKKIDTPTAEADLRALLLIDRKFDRKCKYLLDLLQKTNTSKRANSIIMYFGSSPVLR